MKGVLTISGYHLCARHCAGHFYIVSHIISSDATHNDALKGGGATKVSHRNQCCSHVLTHPYLNAKPLFLLLNFVGPLF